MPSISGVRGHEIRRWIETGQEEPEVYLNGQLLKPGDDYVVEGHEIVPLVKTFPGDVFFVQGRSKTAVEQLAEAVNERG